LKKSFSTIALLLLSALLTFSCSTVKDFIGSPSLAMKSVSISGLDLEGITFKCDYEISNPYPLGFKIKSVAADIIYDSDTKFTSISTANGLAVAAMASADNSFNFKVPYETILTFAKKTSGKKSLPFAVKGNASLNTSKFLGKDLSLPFSKSFDVPVFKPKFSVSEVKVQLPSVAQLTKSLVSGGMNGVNAAKLAADIVAGKSLPENAFDGVNLDMGLNFNLNVANEGSSEWKYALDSCSLNTVAGNLADVAPASSAAISSSSGTIPMTAKLNTIQAGKFIIQLLNKKGSNPTFNVSSKLSFPEISNALNLPLNYSKEIPLSSVALSKS